MPVSLLPDFIVDLQTNADAQFARRVLKNTFLANGEFRKNKKDHRYIGITDAWIRYVSRGHTAFRVIYIQSGANIYLYRAGKHDVENNLNAPQLASLDTAIPVTEIAAIGGKAINTVSTQNRTVSTNRFLRNYPTQDIQRAIFERRNLPHREIWLVAPFITPNLLLPTEQLGKMLFHQIEDGASVSLITSPPKNSNIEWLEKLEERNISVFFHPRLHSKLYFFVLDENRKYARNLPDPNKLSSLLLVGSANMTAAGLALNKNNWNEELCYSVPDSEIDYVETYIADLITRGYELEEARTYRARGQWQKLENYRW